MWCLRRLHLPPPPDKASAYLALWRHVGYYMGVAPSILHRHFASTRAADKFVATAALNLFLEDLTTVLPPSPSSPKSLSSNSPSPSSSPNLPPARPPVPRPDPPDPPRSLPPRAAAHLRLPHYFAAWYPRSGWLAKRRAVLAEGMARSVRGHMGMRRSAFRPRTDFIPPQTRAQEDEKRGEGEVEGEGGELAPGVVEVEAVARDPARAQLLTRQWREVLAELVGVSVVVGVLVSVLAYWSAKCAMAITSEFLHQYLREPQA
uniref:Swi1p n=1 Tax=Ganoderma boninense TaxID=34458 RepID=A0A5K1JRZ3_9APHY|nr:Swi1p [Ganoderma boninense]